MIDALIQQLHDSDPAVRRRAIVALGRTKDAAALRPLAGIVQNDPEPELRDLARKAGQYIRRQMQQQTRPNAPDTESLIVTPTSSTPTVKPLSPSASAPPPRYKSLTDDSPRTHADESTSPTTPGRPTPPPAPRIKSLTDEIARARADEPPPADHAPFMRPSSRELYEPYSYENEPSETEAPEVPKDEPVPAQFMRPAAELYEPYSYENETPETDAPKDKEVPAQFMRPAAELYEPYSYENETPETDAPKAPKDEAPSMFMRPTTASEHEALRRLEDELPDPTFGEEPSLDGLTAVPEPKAKGKDKPAPPAPVVIVRGRKYEIPREDRVRAREYLDGAVTLNMNGNNAKAMKDLTEAISLDPNLINDGFFNNVAATVTGLEGDAAAQMIIDRNQRKRFTEAATRSQEARRIEKHMTEAQKSTWTDVWFEVGLYTLIVIIGPIFVVLVTSEMVRPFLANYAQASKDLPAQLQNAQAAFASLSVGHLLPLAIVSGISGVLSLLFQTVMIHYSAKMLGGVGTWRHLIQVLLGFYNKWFPILFFVLCLTIAITFVSFFSPVVLCAVLILIGLTLYVTGKTSSKVAEAYDFGAAQGCITVIISGLVIGVVNVGIGYLMIQALGLAFNQLVG